MKYHEICSHCGNKVTAYTHNLNQSMVSAFMKMVEYYLKNLKSCNVNTDLDLTHNQLANFQKLRHFGIVQLTQDGYFPTKLGVSFYYGEDVVIVPAASMGNETLHERHPAWATHRGEKCAVFIHDIDEAAYKKRPEYAQERSGQQTMI